MPSAANSAVSDFGQICHRFAATLMASIACWPLPLTLANSDIIRQQGSGVWS